MTCATVRQGRILLGRNRWGAGLRANAAVLYQQRNYLQLAVVNDYFDDGDDLVILRKAVELRLRSEGEGEKKNVPPAVTSASPITEATIRRDN